MAAKAIRYIEEEVPMKFIKSGIKASRKGSAIPDIIKVVGINGQISLGKGYAGRTVRVSVSEDETVTIKPGKFVPDNEKWLYEGDNLQKLHEVIEWAENTPRKDNFEELFSAFKKWSDEND